MAELNDAYYDSLLDDPVDNNEPDVEPEVDPADNEPFIPDQEGDNSSNDDTDGEGGDGSEDDEDVLTSYLKSRGIADPTKIKFETDEGGEEEKD